MLSTNHLFLYGLIATCCVIEGTLVLSDHGVLGPDYLRQFVYHYGAFWPGLLDNWKPNYAAQPYSMFITYNLLHGGLPHLAVNMIALWSLGHAVLHRVGSRGFVALYFFTSISGAGVFALLAPSLRPMVGASGALFGLLGALLAWQYLENRADRNGLRRLARVIVLLAVLNFVLWWAMDGQLAWEAHLGGLVAGWVAALVVDRK